MEQNNYELVIGIKDSNGRLIESQPFNEFMHGKKNIPILNMYTGQ